MVSLILAFVPPRQDPQNVLEAFMLIQETLKMWGVWVILIVASNIALSLILAWFLMNIYTEMKK